MPKLFAITALLIGGFGATLDKVPAPSTAVGTPPLVSPASTRPYLDPEKRAWFDQAIGHILGDETDDVGPSPARRL